MQHRDLVNKKMRDIFFHPSPPAQYKSNDSSPILNLFDIPPPSILSIGSTRKIPFSRQTFDFLNVYIICVPQN